MVENHTPRNRRSNSARSKISMRLLSISSFICAFLAFQPFPLVARDCNSLLNSVLHTKFQEAIDKQDVCAGLKRKYREGCWDLGPLGKGCAIDVTLGIDKTEVARLNHFQYCYDSANTYIDGNIFVRCRTSPAAVVQMSLQEDFRFDAKIDNASCRVVSFDASPRGDIGRIIAANTSFKADAKRSLESELHNFCNP